MKIAACTTKTSVFQAFRLGPDSHHQVSWFSGLRTQTETPPLALLGLQLVDGRLWDCQRP